MNSPKNNAKKHLSHTAYNFNDHIVGFVILGVGSTVLLLQFRMEWLIYSHSVFTYVSFLPIKRVTFTALIRKVNCMDTVVDHKEKVRCFKSKTIQ